MQSYIFLLLLLFTQPEDLHQVSNEDGGTEEHQRDKLEDCCCQCTSLSFFLRAMRKKPPQKLNWSREVLNIVSNDSVCARLLPVLPVGCRHDPRWRENLV